MRRPSARVLALLALLALVTLFLAGCGGFRGNENQYYNAERAKYYQGYDGVNARFDQVPQKLFYYGNAEASAANDFPLSVAVLNKGASYTRGAVFLSGYDPNLIQFDEVPIALSYPGACSLRIGDWSLNKFGMMVQCGDSFSWRGHEGNWLESISVHGKTWFKGTPLENLLVDFTSNNRGDSITFNWDAWTFEAREHGIALIAILAGLSFRAFLGQEYLLAGDTYDYPGGEMDYIEYHGHIANWPQGTDDIQQTFLLTNCYMYTTFAAPLVCIDPQPYSENRKVCTPSVATWKSGQGAPVSISRITQENTPRTAVFHIEVTNSGGGTVFDAGSLEKCSPYYPGGAKSNDLNAIWIGEVRIGDRLLQCTPENYIRLQGNRASFTCVYPIEYAELNSAYQTPLVIELWYGYSTTTQRNVLVKRVS